MSLTIFPYSGRSDPTYLTNFVTGIFALALRSRGVCDCAPALSLMQVLCACLMAANALRGVAIPLPADFINGSIVDDGVASADESTAIWTSETFSLVDSIYK